MKLLMAAAETAPRVLKVQAYKHTSWMYLSNVVPDFTDQVPKLSIPVAPQIDRAYGVVACVSLSNQKSPIFILIVAR